MVSGWATGCGFRSLRDCTWDMIQEGRGQRQKGAGFETVRWMLTSLSEIVFGHGFPLQGFCSKESAA